MFEISVDPSNLDMTRQNSVYGSIFVRLGDVAFPSETYCDFVFPILEWWAKEIQFIIKRPKTDNIDDFSYLIFMDSSKAVRLKKMESDVVCECGVLGYDENLLRNFTVDGPTAIISEQLLAKTVVIANELLAKNLLDRVTESGVIEDLKMYLSSFGDDWLSAL